jgi:PDZ domain-containing secreted protein
MRFLSPARTAAALVAAAAATLVVLYVVPSNDYYVFVPDRAHALAPLVKVPGTHPRRDGGGVYFVDVRFRKARLLEDMLNRPLGSGSSLEPATAVLGGRRRSSSAGST